MPSEHTILKSSETQGIELKSYNVSIPMGTLAIGVDNIHHDVFLSPKFVQAARDYLLDLIRQHTSSAHSLGMEPRPTRGLDRKSTRLNSSHVSISYAVFCLKKKNHKYKRLRPPNQYGDLGVSPRFPLIRRPVLRT